MDDHINTMPLYSNTFRNESGGSVVSYYSIRSTSQLETNVGDTKYVLRPGTYYFDTGGASRFVLDKPFELDDSAGGTIEIIANLFYIGTGPLFQQAIGNQLILRITDTVLLGGITPPSTKTLFDLSFSTVGSRPILLLNFVQCVLWHDLGDIKDFDTVVINNYADQVNGSGLAIFDATNLVNIGTATLSSSYVAASRLSIVQGASLVTGTSIQVSGVQFTPDVSLTQYAFNIDGALQPNAIISGSVFNDNNNLNAAFYNPLGLDQDSLFVISKNVKNVSETKIGGSYFVSSGGVVAFTQAITIQDQYYVMPGTDITSPPIVEDTNERVTTTILGTSKVTLLTHNTLETTRVRIKFSATISTPAASADYAISVYRLFGNSTGFPQFTWDTTLGLQNITVTGGGTHTYVGGEEVSLAFSNGTVTGVILEALYIVVFISNTTIRLQPAPSTTPITPNQTTVGNLVTNVCEQIGHIPQVGVKNTTNGSYVATDVPTISAANMNGAGNPDFFVPVIKNVSGTDDVNIYSYNFGINE